MAITVFRERSAKHQISARRQRDRAIPLRVAGYTQDVIARGQIETVEPVHLSPLQNDVLHLLGGSIILHTAESERHFTQMTAVIDDEDDLSGWAVDLGGFETKGA
jgi:hypothetical protein